MGCSPSSSNPFVSSKKKHSSSMKTPFPLSYYEKTLIKDVWSHVKTNALEIGLKIFYNLFQHNPDLIHVFPEFHGVEDPEEILTWIKLEGHPLKIYSALDRAVMSLDDGDTFIERMEKLGEKHHENNLQPEYLNALGAAITETFGQVLGENIWTSEVEKAWKEMYIFICKLMKQGLAAAKSNRTSTRSNILMEKSGDLGT